MIALPLVVLVFGVVSIIFPEIGWRLTNYGDGRGEGISKRDIDPSYGEIIIQRIVGAMFIIFAVILFFFIMNRSILYAQI